MSLIPVLLLNLSFLHQHSLPPSNTSDSTDSTQAYCHCKSKLRMMVNT